MDEKTIIKIPKRTIEEIKKIIGNSDEDSIAKYIENILIAICKKVENNCDGDEKTIDEQIVKKRLAELGYLD
ncbi:MAG: hypothetical protein ACFFDN_06185 [Candidatus Hodarchaeota archaeon]